jgi:hypothetical protein
MSRAEAHVGPFGFHAMDLHDRGLVPIPVGGAHGKKPLIMGWNRKRSSTALRALIGKFADAQIGIACGPSGLTVVDIDDPLLEPEMIERFGDTPLKQRSPGGGTHLFYRDAGEGCPSLRTEGKAVDIKGHGGFVMVVWSIRTAGVHAGKPYAFRGGSSWDDLPNLPRVKPGSLPPAWNPKVQGPAMVIGDRAEHPPESPNGVKKGRRNKELFSYGLRVAWYCYEADDPHLHGDVPPPALLDELETANDNFDPPLPQAEVKHIARSVWNYERHNRNFVGSRGYGYYASFEALDLLVARPHGADVYTLYHLLKRHHWRDAQFPASPDAMAERNLIAGWGAHRYRKALTILVEVRLLAIVRPGGHGHHDPRLFTFTRWPSRFLKIFLNSSLQNQKT